MTTPKNLDEEIDEEKEEALEAPKPHIPVQKVSRFGPQNTSKFGK